MLTSVSHWFLLWFCCLYSLAGGLISLGCCRFLMFSEFGCSFKAGWAASTVACRGQISWASEGRGSEGNGPPVGPPDPQSAGHLAWTDPRRWSAHGGPHSSVSGLLLFLASLLPSALLLSLAQHPSHCFFSVSFFFCFSPQKVSLLRCCSQETEVLRSSLGELKPTQMSSGIETSSDCLMRND